MKSILAACMAALLAGNALAESMSVLKELKLQDWAREAAEGAFDLDRYEVLEAVTPCTNGRAGEYRCSNVDLVSFLRHQDMGSATRTGNDVCMYNLRSAYTKITETNVHSFSRGMDFFHWPRVRRRWPNGRYRLR